MFIYFRRQYDCAERHTFLNYLREISVQEYEKNVQTGIWIWLCTQSFKYIATSNHKTDLHAIIDSLDFFFFLLSRFFYFLPR